VREHAETWIEAKGDTPMRLAGILLALVITTTVAHATFYQRTLYERLGGRPALALPPDVQSATVVLASTQEEATEGCGGHPKKQAVAILGVRGQPGGSGAHRAPPHFEAFFSASPDI